MYIYTYIFILIIISPLKLKNMFQSNPQKSRLLVRRLAVQTRRSNNMSNKSLEHA